MTTANLGHVLRQLRKLTGANGEADLSDGELLERFHARRDEAAFAVLVERHGPMVLGLCRRVLGDLHDAEDAFQATFLVLAKKAGSIRKQEALGCWLYGVARRVANSARARELRRRTRERRSLDMPRGEAFDAVTWQELGAVLDEEIGGLADKYRAPLVLCYLEGKTHEQAAQELCCPKSSLTSRLTRARKLLHGRLTQRGIALSGGGLLALLTGPQATAAMPGMLVLATVRAAALWVTGKALVTTVVSPAAAELARNTLQGIAMSKLKIVGLAFVAMALMVAGAGAVGYRALNVNPQAAKQEAARDEGGQDRAKADAADRLDLHGDPLPPGVLVRFGTTRLRHGVNLQSLVFSPDGKIIYSAGGGPLIHVWDAFTGKELRTFPSPAKWVGSIALAPDGKRLACAGQDGAVHLLDPESGNEIDKFVGHKEVVNGVAYSAKGDLLISGSRDMSVCLWETATGKLRQRMVGHDKEVNSVALSPDGKLAASSAYDQTVRIWDTATGKELHKISVKEGHFYRVAFAADSKTLATAEERQARLWDAATGRELHRLGDHKNWLSTVAFAPTGKIVATAERDGMVRLWDTATGKKLREFRGHPDGVLTVAFSPDGRIVTGAAEAHIRLWEVASGNQLQVRQGHQERVTAVAHAPDGKLIATGAWDGTVRIWDAASAKEVRKIEPSARAYINGVDFSRDGKLLLVASRDSDNHQYSLVLWEVATGKQVRTLPGEHAVFSPDGKLLACAGRGDTDGSYNRGIVRLFETQSFKEVGRLEGHKYVITCLTFSADSRYLLTGSQAQFLGARIAGEENPETDAFRLWDIAGRKELRAFGGRRIPRSVALSRDGRTAATTDLTDGTITLWETVTGEERGRIDTKQSMVFSVAFAPDGRTLAAGCEDGFIRLYDYLTGKEVGRLAGHRGWVLEIDFAPDGRTLTSTGIDTTALVWDLAGKLAPRPTPTTDLGSQELTAAWDALAGDASRARAAVVTLADAKAGIGFLRDKVRPAIAAEPTRLAELIADLGSDRFAARKNATEELEKLADLAEPALKRALAAKPTLEVARRIEALLDRGSKGPPPREQLRRLRALEVLERLASPEARQLLAALAGGAAEARLTVEARRTLDRLGR
jgi:RNA polymerase sigma factor (sigma-70 family)